MLGHQACKECFQYSEIVFTGLNCTLSLLTVFTARSKVGIRSGISRIWFQLQDNPQHLVPSLNASGRFTPSTYLYTECFPYSRFLWNKDTRAVSILFFSKLLIWFIPIFVKFLGFQSRFHSFDFIKMQKLNCWKYYCTFNFNMCDKYIHRKYKCLILLFAVIVESNKRLNDWIDWVKLFVGPVKNLLM